MSAFDGAFDGLALIGSCDVTVWRREQKGTDDYNAPVYGEWEPEEVPGVLPTVGGSQDLEASRPEGVTVSMTFHFPKGYGKSLRGCLIEHGGGRYRVIGDPQPIIKENVPGPWNLSAECEACDG